MTLPALDRTNRNKVEGLILIYLKDIDPVLLMFLSKEVEI